MADLEKDLRQYVGKEYYKAGLQSLASGFAQVAGGAVNYNALRTDAYGLGVQADSVELQAEQQANLLREQFIGAMGNALYGSTRRGVRASSNFVSDNIARSSEDLGKDIALNQKNARMQADALRSQAKIMKRRGKAQMVGAAMSGISSLASAVGYGIKGYELRNPSKSQKTPPVPPKKPF